MDDEIFGQKTLTENKRADRSEPSDLIQKVVDFIDDYEDVAIASDQLKRLRFIGNILLGKNKDFSITWLFSYRCALISKVNRGCFEQPVKNLILIGLSEFGLKIQHEWSDMSGVQTAESTSFNVCPIEPVRLEKFSDFMMQFNSALIAKQPNKLSPLTVQQALETAHQAVLGKQTVPSLSGEGLSG